MNPALPPGGLFQPPPGLRQLQAEGPISRIRTPVGDEAWVVTRHREVKQLFADERLGRTHPDPERAPRVLRSAVLDAMLQGHATEPVDHPRVRAQLGPFFSVSSMKAFRPLMKRLVDEVLDAMGAKGTPGDIHKAFSRPLAVHAISKLMGVPKECTAELYSWCQRTFEPKDLSEEHRSIAGLIEFLKPLVLEKRMRPGEDMISKLSRETYADNPAESIAFLAGGIFFAGYTNTVRVMDLSVLLLLANPDQRRALSEDPSLLTQAREESLRLSRSSGGSHPRYARSDIEIGGITIRTGDLVLLDLGAANHDELVFSDPDRFDITRRSNRHLSFGASHWFCVGAPFARLELDIALLEIVRRFPAMRLAVPDSQVSSLVNPMTGALTGLPVDW